MKKLFVVGFLMTAALGACGSKNKSSTTTPDNKGGSAEMKSGATGGAAYGDANKTPAGTPASGASADPCAGGQ